MVVGESWQLVAGRSSLRLCCLHRVAEKAGPLLQVAAVALARWVEVQLQQDEPLVGGQVLRDPVKVGMLLDHLFWGRGRHGLFVMERWDLCDESSWEETVEAEWLCGRRPSERQRSPHLRQNPSRAREIQQSSHHLLLRHSRWPLPGRG